MTHISIDKVENCRYDLHGVLYFEDSNKNAYKISQKDALEIAYTLFDSVGRSYKELDEISEELDD